MVGAHLCVRLGLRALRADTWVCPYTGGAVRVGKAITLVQAGVNVPSRRERRD